MDRIIKIKALLEKWRCKSCVSGNTNQENATNQEVPDVQLEVQPELQEQPTERKETTEEKKLCMHFDFGKPIRRKGVEFSECKGVVHAQPTCSGMSRAQTKTIKKKKTKWKCDGCKEIIVNPYPAPETDTEVEYHLADRKTKNSLKILQWNVDSYLSKNEEF